MSYVLNSRERAALEKIEFLGTNDFHAKGHFGTNIGPVTLDALVSLGLLETGPSRRSYGAMGWCVTPDAYRCMYGKTHAEIVEEGGQHYPLRVWSWPPSSC